MTTRLNRRVAALALLSALVVAGTVSGMSARAEAAVTWSGGGPSHVTPRPIAVRMLGAVPVGTVANQNPFAGRQLYVDPNSTAAQTSAALRTADPVTSNLLAKVARGATADWWTGEVSGAALTSAVAARTRTISAAGAVPVYVLYDLPHRDCGSYSAGGATSAAAYEAWIRAFATGLPTAPAAVILEPDALAQLTCLPADAQSERLALLRYAVATLRAKPGVGVYLDSGNAKWVPAATMAARLKAAGVLYARGFSVNVSSFDTTASESAYGHAISAATGGVHFVVDTSRNGRGMAPDNAWCNPPGRGLGSLPDSLPADRLIDAYLWVKPPGFSDGTCNGGPAAGTWWTAYASGLAANAAW